MPRDHEEETAAYPGGKRFAFTILDDTDDSTVENVGPLYDLLYSLGFRTTKTVWPLACPEGSATYFAGETMSDPAYAAFCLELAERGFELTWHDATMESSRRERTEAGLEAFRSQFGRYPRVHANHGQNKENIYWGHKRYHQHGLRLLSRLATTDHGFQGEDPESEYFWGDLCKQHFTFVRNFTFYEINTLNADPDFPYRVTSTPFVNYWFSTSDAPDVTSFNRLVTKKSVDRLVDEGGICILSTHLGKGFTRNGRVDPGVEDSLRYIASRNGWFATVSEILDHRLSSGHGSTFKPSQLRALEWRHAADRVRGLR